MYSHLEPVVVGQGDVLNEPVFTGYAFLGVDLVIGSEAYREWAKKHTTRDVLHQDGCYFTARDVDGEIVIGADVKGYCKVFIYRSAGRWATSNSFEALVRYARARSWSITPNRGVLSGWDLPGTFWQQLTTFETAAEEISLMPRRSVLRVSRDGLLAESSSPPDEAVEDPDQYRTLLGKFLQTWIGRVGTCLRADASQVELELTGGLDSRVTFAIALGLRQYFDVPFRDRVSVRSAQSQEDDLRCATHIANTYRISINPAERKPPNGLDRFDRLGRWRSFALGSYGPIYMPPKSAAVRRFVVGGHGGESHRVFWAQESPTSFLDASAHILRQRGTFRRIQQSFLDASDKLEHHYPQLPPTIRHYREFRDRLHGGLHAQQLVRLQPLSSRLLDAATQCLSEGALKRGQMLYDVIAQTAPGLLDMPFDKISKVPGPEVQGDIANPVALRPMRGRIYGPTSPTSILHSEDPLPQLEELFDEAVTRGAGELVGADAVADARMSLSRWKDTSASLHPKYSRTIHQVILADLVSR